jgi:hypothetical protein
VATACQRVSSRSFLPSASNSGPSALRAQFSASATGGSVGVAPSVTLIHEDM